MAITRWLSGLVLLGGAAAQAETMDQCLLLAVQSAAETTTVGELRAICTQRLAAPAAATAGEEPALKSAPVTPLADAIVAATEPTSAVEKRLALERYTRDNPFVLTPHRPNYVLPAVYTKDPNEAPFAAEDPGADLRNIELQFQLSLKVLVWENVFRDNGHLSFAYTNRSFWQAYNREISSAFRETNHEPELLLTFENDWEIYGFRNVANQVILNHQSNGRGGSLSRSWNRVMFNAIFEKDNFVFALKPWYRIPEDDKRYPDDPDGDDNPDIERYMGHFEWIGSWQRQQNTYTLMLRNNLRSDNRGAVELGWSYPLNSRIKTYVKYFNGYGESLIDYDQSTESLGVGFLISDWF